jgi:hypothetical protein
MLLINPIGLQPAREENQALSSPRSSCTSSTTYDAKERLPIHLPNTAFIWSKCSRFPVVGEGVVSGRVHVNDITCPILLFQVGNQRSHFLGSARDSDSVCSHFR